MGRRLNISQPAVIQTELRPLDESFWIDANGQLEQWYYQNTNVFAPDRQITPLILTPHLSAVDRDTNTSYTPTFQLDRWLVKEYKDGAWVTTTITSQDPTADYEIVDGIKLKVNKNNYDATHAINITCKATYQDPRDVGVLHNTEESVMLVTSVDATQAFPNIDIVEAATRTYNPLKDESPIFEFEGKADWEGVEAQGGTAITECKVDPLGTEQILPTNDEMMLNAAPTLNIHYGDIEKANQKFVYRQTANGEVSEIVGGVSAIDNIKGNTVVWNQLVDKNNLADTSSGSNITLTNNGDGSFTLSGSQNSNFEISALKYRMTLISGHKYFFKGCPEGGVVVVTYWMTLWTNDSVEYLNAEGGNGCIFTWNDGYVNLSIYITLAANIQAPSGRWIPQLFDLTLMFGEGNEPATVEEFETWLANNVGVKDYYEYCSGKLVNFGGFGVKMNQIAPQDLSAYDGSVVKNENEYVYTANTTGYNMLYKPHDFSGHIYYGFLFAKSSVNADVSMSWNNSDSPSWSMGIASSSFSRLSGYGFINSTANQFEIHFSNISAGISVHVKNIVFIDLTEMFGAGNEPDLEWCDKYFSKDYYPYCPSVEKNILDVMTTKESGFNIWDETYDIKPEGSISFIQSHFIKVEPNTKYYLKQPKSYFGLLYYDESYTLLSSGTSVGEFTTPNNCKYLKFQLHNDYGTTYNHDVCLNLFDEERNGEYEPYHVQYKSPEMGIKTTGFNLWDEEWEKGMLDTRDGQKRSNNDYVRTKNFNKVLPNTDYYYRVPNSIGVDNINIFYYDENKEYIGFVSNVNRVKKTPSNCCYIMFYLDDVYGTTYNHDICINISNPSKNGTYEPYWESKSDMSWITKIGIENFNIWDEEWEVGNITDGEPDSGSNRIRSKNHCPCSGNTSYYATASVQIIWWYDGSKNYLSYTVIPSGGLVTSPQGARFFKINTSASYGENYNHDICINLSNDHFNGRYYPHGETAPYFPQGLCKAGSVFDEVKVENGKIKGVVRIGSVDLGDWNWVNEGKSYHTYTTNSQGKIKTPPTFYQAFNGNCSKLTVVQWDGQFYTETGYEYSISLHTNGNISIYDQGLPTPFDAAQAKAYLKGVMLYYELATPYEFEIDYPTKGQFMWYGVNGSGSEVPIDQLPIYSQATQPSGYGQGTSRININALYGENIPVILRVKRYPWSPTVLPPRVTKSVAWSIPPIDVITTCDKGSAVRATNINTNFVFGTIVNQQGDTISDEKKAENLVFKWYMVKYGNSGTATETFLGNGQTVSVLASLLKNTTPSGGVTPSTNVYCEAFLLGAYHLVEGKYVRTIE